MNSFHFEILLYNHFPETDVLGSQASALPNGGALLFFLYPLSFGHQCECE